MTNTMKRVAIIGCPGSGKTTFAKEIAKVTGLPLIHLDLYYHDQEQDHPNNREAWHAKVTELAEQDAWIIEGNYKSTFDIRLPRADTIIFLDYPRRVVLWRMLKRRIQYQFKRRDDMPDTWREHISWDFFRFVWNFNGRERPRIMALLEEHRSRRSVTILHSQADADALLISSRQI